MARPRLTDAERRERERETKRSYRERNRERINASYRTWWAANRDRLSTQRRARKLRRVLSGLQGERG